MSAASLGLICCSCVLLLIAGYQIARIGNRVAESNAFRDGVAHARRLVKTSAAYFVVEDPATSNVILALGEDQPMHQILKAWRSTRSILSPGYAKRRPVNIRKCARCGGDHDGLGFTAFVVPVELAPRSPSYTHWAACPKTGEPILMTVISDDEGDLERQRRHLTPKGDSAK